MRFFTRRLPRSSILNSSIIYCIVRLVSAMNGGGAPGAALNRQKERARQQHLAKWGGTVLTYPGPPQLPVF